jgi:hypothetical protein
MTDAAAAAAPLAPGLDAQVAALAPRDVVVGLCTYDNAATVGRVLGVVREGLSAFPASAGAAIVNADAGSADGTPEAVRASGLPAVLGAHQAPLGERAAVPFHGVPGRNGAVRLVLDVAERLGARVVLLLEADVTSIEPDWIARLGRPVWEDKADLMLAVHARHRYDGTITNLLLAPIVRALYGRRLRQPFGSALALSGRLLQHVLAQGTGTGGGRELIDLGIAGTAIADGFAVWECWLGRRRVESRTRTTDLPAMVAQTLGGILAVMERQEETWRDVRGSEPVTAVGEPSLPSVEARPVQVDRMVAGFRLGLRDLASIWELVLTPETLGDVLALDVPDVERFRFPDDLWARVVSEFSLGHHYAVVHRDHLLRSLVPLYLGRTASFVLATEPRDAAATEAQLERQGMAFERQKPYLVERWR